MEPTQNALPNATTVPPVQNTQAQSIKLSDTQKRVLSRIVAAPTPKVAADEVSNNENLIAARDLLVKLGMITSDPGNVALTDQGTQAMKDSALIDDAGQLTDDGQMYAHTDEHGKPEEEKPGVPPETSPLGEIPPLGTPVPGPTPGFPSQETRLPPMEREDTDEKFKTLKMLLEENGKKYVVVYQQYGPKQAFKPSFGRTKFTTFEEAIDHARSDAAKNARVGVGSWRTGYEPLGKVVLTDDGANVIINGRKDCSFTVVQVSR